MRVKNIIQLHKRIAAGAGKTVIHSSIEGYLETISTAENDYLMDALFEFSVRFT